MDISQIIKALTDAGASIATIIILAYLLVQQNKMLKEFRDSIQHNTDAVKGLKEVIRGCGANNSNKRELKKN